MIFIVTNVFVLNLPTLLTSTKNWYCRGGKHTITVWFTDRRVGRVSDGDLSHVYTGVWGSEILVWVRCRVGRIIAIGSNRRPPEPYSFSTFNPGIFIIYLSSYVFC